MNLGATIADEKDLDAVSNAIRHAVQRLSYPDALIEAVVAGARKAHIAYVDGVYAGSSLEPLHMGFNED